MIREKDDRAQFLKERKTAIGGSDVPALLNMAPYGCKRRLWYDKKNIKPDFAQVYNNHMKRGNYLEDFALEFFAESAAVSIYRPAWKLHDHVPYFGCHADGLIENNGGYRDTLLEVKIPQARVFYAVRTATEPPLDAMVQAMWGAMIHGVDQIAVQLWSPDAWNDRKWFLPVDKAMMADIADIGHGFWTGMYKEKENPYPKLPITDKRCKTCQWRKACQGLGAEAADPDYDPEVEASRPEIVKVVETESFNEAATDFLAARKAKKAAEEAEKLAKARLVGMFPHPGVVECAAGKVSLKVIRRKAYTSVVPETTYEQLTVKPKVEEIDDVDAE